MLLAWLTFFQEYAGRVATAASIIALAEHVFPQSRYSLISRARGAIFWIVYIAITGAGLVLFGRLWATLGISPLFHIDLRFLSSAQNGVISIMGATVAAWLVMQVGEFFYYWFHRLQHASKFFWRFHAEHHSLEEMSAFNSNHHFTEELFRLPFVTIPLSLLFSFEQGYVPWLWALLMGWQGIYVHSSTRLHLGWFRYIVPDNRFHRVHHSVEKRHFDKNFGSASALWDIIFRTVHHPKRDEWPDVGLDRMKQPATLKEFLFRPFRSTEPHA